MILGFIMIYRFFYPENPENPVNPDSNKKRVKIYEQNHLKFNTPVANSVQPKEIKILISNSIYYYRDLIMKIFISKRVSQRSNVIRRCLGLSVVGIGLNLGAVSVVQAATDCNAVTEISPAECVSLLELYHSTNGANWKYNEGWNVTDTPCSWYGITCLNGGVSKIVLQDNQLTGTIPDFTNLSNLEAFWLHKNQLTGTIPDFSTLPKLKELWFHKNQLTGTIPNFSGLPHLESLSLGGNQLCKAPDTDYSPWQSKVDSYPDCPKSQHTLTIDKTGAGEGEGEGEGNITGNGINCGSDCIKEYVENTSITLTATPDANSVFEGWSGACSGTGNCQVTLTADKNVTAIFNLKDYQLTVSKQGAGNVEGNGINCGSDCSEDYKANTSVTLTPTADADSIFADWSGVCSGDAVTCVVKMSSDKTVTVSFDLCEYTVESTNQTHKSNADNGSITVEVSNDKCPWAAISHNDDWLKITSPKDNHGNGEIDYSVADNSNTADREGTLTIAGQKVTIYQGIYEKPIASFTATPLSGMAPLTVKLDANDSSDSDGEIVSYEWAISDEQTASGKTAELTFAGDKSCHPTITLTVTDNDGLSDQTEETISIENCAIVEFQGIEDYYRVGDFVRAEVKIDVNVGRFKRVDLWMAISMPSGVLIYRTPLGINSFSPNPQAFKESLESQTVNHRLLDFEVPPGLGGTYLFYALIVDEGEDPLEHLDELVVQETALE
jgi:hypothetical protein